MASKTQRNRGRFYPVPIDDYGRICVTFEIPNHTYYKAAVRGVLHDLEAASSWHYTRNPGDTNASKVGQLFRQLLLETYRYSTAPCRTNCPDTEPCDCPECEDCEDYIEDEFCLDEDEIHMLLDCYKHTVGDIKMSAVPTVSGGWLLCDGSSHSKLEYPELAAALEGVTFSDETTFATPDFSLRSPMGTGYHDDIGALPPLGTAGSLTHTLTEAEMPEHSHEFGDHSHSVPAHNHTVAAHTHVIPAHTHSAADHDHTIPDVPVPVRQNGVIGAGNRVLAGTGAGTSATIDVAMAKTGVSGMAINPHSGDSTESGGGGTTGDSAVLATSAASGTSGGAGDGEAHNTVHPVIGVLFYIFAGCAVSGEDCL